MILARVVPLCLVFLSLVTALPVGSPATGKASENPWIKKPNTAGRPAKLEPNKVWLELGDEKSEESEAGTTGSSKQDVSPSSAPIPEATSQSDAKATSSVTQPDKVDVGKVRSADVEIDEPSSQIETVSPSPKYEENTYKCDGVRCSPPPRQLPCFEISLPPILTLGLPQKACCPVHSCRRDDGSVFVHYAVEIDDTRINEAGVTIPAPLSHTPNPFQNQILPVTSEQPSSLAPNPLTPILPFNSNLPQLSSSSGSSFYSFNSGTAGSSQGAPGQAVNPMLPAPQGLQFPFGGARSPTFQNNRFPIGSAMNVAQLQQSQIPAVNSLPLLGTNSGLGVDVGNSLYRLSRTAPAIPNFPGGFSGIQYPFTPLEPWKTRRNSFEPFGFQYGQGRK